MSVIIKWTLNQCEVLGNKRGTKAMDKSVCSSVFCVFLIHVPFNCFSPTYLQAWTVYSTAWYSLPCLLVAGQCTLQWHHNRHDSVSNHQPHDCFLKRLFKRRSKKTSKLRVTGLCAGNSPGAGEFPAQMASYAENVSIWWRHHEHATNELTWRNISSASHIHTVLLLLIWVKSILSAMLSFIVHLSILFSAASLGIG